MILDTGLSYMMAPQEDVDIIMSTLKEKGIECNDSKYGSLTTAECTCTLEKYESLNDL